MEKGEQEFSLSFLEWESSYNKYFFYLLPSSLHSLLYPWFFWFEKELSLFLLPFRWEEKVIFCYLQSCRFLPDGRLYLGLTKIFNRFLSRNFTLPWSRYPAKRHSKKLSENLLRILYVWLECIFLQLFLEEFCFITGSLTQGRSGHGKYRRFFFKRVQ